MEADIELVDLGLLANRLQSQFQPLADEKGLSFAIELASDLSSTIATEGRKVEQIVGNLLANAIKFTNFGSVILRIGHPDATPMPPPSSGVATLLRRRRSLSP